MHKVNAGIGVKVATLEVNCSIDEEVSVMNCKADLNEHHAEVICQNLMGDHVLLELCSFGTCVRGERDGLEVLKFSDLIIDFCLFDVTLVEPVGAVDVDGLVLGLDEKRLFRVISGEELVSVKVNCTSELRRLLQELLSNHDGVLTCF